MQNTFKLIENVLLNPNIKASDIAVFFSLFSRMGTKGYCYPSVDTIVQETGYSERAVQLSTNRLEREGYIAKESRMLKGKQSSNYYCLLDNKFENTENSKDSDVRDIICNDDDFMAFSDKYSVKVKNNFKLAAVNFIERNLCIDKRENTFLLYSVLVADQEACMYFCIDKLAKKLSMAVSRIRNILQSLEEKGFIKVITKTINGREIGMIRINVEVLDRSFAIRTRLKDIIIAKKQMVCAFSVFMCKKISSNEKVAKINNVFFNNRLVRGVNAARGVLDRQLIGLHNLFRKFLHPKRTIVIKRTKEGLLKKIYSDYY